MTLPTWMRRALFATAVMNILAAAMFAPPARGLRALAGMPEGEHPLYLATVGMFVLLFGLGYLATALAGRADRLFVTLAAAGKASFSSLCVWYWAAGTVSGRAALMSSADLVFAILFTIWLLETRRPAAFAAPAARGGVASSPPAA